MKLSQKYLLQFTDDQIKKRLLTRHNFFLLEEILESEISAMKTDKYDLPWQQMSKPQILAEFPKVKGVVDQFFDVTDIKAPKIAVENDYFPEFLDKAAFDKFDLFYFMPLGYTAYTAYSHFLNQSPEFTLLACATTAFLTFALTKNRIEDSKKNFYYPNQQRIKIYQHSTRDHIIASLGHEYAHHIQNTKGIFGDDLKCIMEGLSRGVEDELAKVYTRDEKKSSYVSKDRVINVSELQMVYRWMKDEMGLKASPVLLDPKSQNGRDHLNYYHSSGVTNHAWGNVFCKLLVHERDSKIYADIVNGRFSF